MNLTSTLRVGGFLGRRAISRGNRGVVVLTCAMMAVVFAELLFIPALIRNATDRIEQELRGSLTANITVAPSGSRQTIPEAASLLPRIRSVPGVAGATGTALAGLQISTANRSGSWSVLAIDPASYATTFTTPSHLLEGSFLRSGDDTDGIVLGIGIAGAGDTAKATYGNSLQTVHVGNDVTVTTIDGSSAALRVVGIYDDQFDQANVRAFIPEQAAARLVPQLRGQADDIYVRTRTIGDETAVIARLRQLDPTLTYRPWQELASAVRDITGSFDTIRSILGAVSLVVAAITVFIVTYVDLINRRRTIGIERAIGIRATAIVTSYVLKAVVFAAIGIVLGAILFRFIAVPLVNRYPFQFPIGPVTLTVTAAEMRSDALILVIVAVVGALLPAWTAVRTRIIDAIWG